MVGWLVGWLVGCLVGCLVGWLIVVVGGGVFDVSWFSIVFGVLVAFSVAYLSC